MDSFVAFLIDLIDYEDYLHLFEEDLIAFDFALISSISAKTKLEKQREKINKKRQRRLIGNIINRLCLFIVILEFWNLKSHTDF